MTRLNTHKVQLDGIGTVSIMTEWSSALSHLCDHVISRPEAHCWTVLIADYDRVPVANRTRFWKELAKTAWRHGSEGNPPDIVWLHDEYTWHIEQALLSASAEQWTWQEREGRRVFDCALGLTGVFVVHDRQKVLTAYLPQAPIGSSDADMPRGRKARRRNPVPRDNGAADPREPWAFDQANGWNLFEVSGRRVRRRQAIASVVGRSASRYGAGQPRLAPRRKVVGKTPYFRIEEPEWRELTRRLFEGPSDSDD